MKEASIFIKVKDEDVTKLLYFTKPKMKSKMFYEALIYYILNSDNIEDFANPVFKEEFRKYVKKIQSKYKVNVSKKDIEEKKVEKIDKKLKTEKTKKDNEMTRDSEEDEEFF